MQTEYLMSVFATMRPGLLGRKSLDFFPGQQKQGKATGYIDCVLSNQAVVVCPIEVTMLVGRWVELR